MICNDCIHLETFGEKSKNEFWNKCALLDIPNLEEGEECEYFEAIPRCPKCGKALIHENACSNCGWETYTQEKESGCIII